MGKSTYKGPDQSREWRRLFKENHPEEYLFRQRSYVIKRHNITPEIYDAILEGQDGKCTICYLESNEPLVIDHNHDCCPGPNSCGLCIRGLICRGCNIALGSTKDNPETLESAASYIRRHQLSRPS